MIGPVEEGIQPAKIARSPVGYEMFVADGPEIGLSGFVLRRAMEEVAEGLKYAGGPGLKCPWRRNTSR